MVSRTESKIRRNLSGQCQCTDFQFSLTDVAVARPGCCWNFCAEYTWYFVDCKCDFRWRTAFLATCLIQFITVPTEQCRAGGVPVWIVRKWCPIVTLKLAITLLLICIHIIAILAHCLKMSIMINVTFSFSVLWRCWLGGRKGIRPVKNWVVGCWHGYLSGARCRLAYGPADATTTHCLLLQWNPNWFYLSGTGSPG